MSFTIENEKAFLGTARKLYGPDFEHHLLTKPFTSPEFLHCWAAITQIVNAHQLGPRILDVGCGPGWTSIFLALRGLSVTAADVSPDMLTLAQQNASRFNLPVTFLECDMQKSFPIAPESFDAVLIFDALHHTPDEKIVLEHCFRVLRPGGKILLSEPDWFHAHSPHSKHDREKFGTTERGLGFRRLKKSLKAAGFTQPRRTYCTFDTCTASPWKRCKTLASTLFTLTVGFPRHPVIAFAIRPH